MNDSYNSLSVVFVTEKWELVALPSPCTKSESSNTGKDLVHAMVMQQDLGGHVTG